MHGHVLYVLNAGGAGNITGFVVKHNGLTPLAGSTRPLGAGSAGPAQVSFAPNGKTLVVTEKASSTIDTYAVGPHGVAGPPIVNAAVGATPFGFDFDKRGNVLTSNAAGSASSYDIGANGSLSVISGAVHTFQGAPCWLVDEHERPLRVHRERRKRDDLRLLGRPRRRACAAEPERDQRQPRRR